MAASPGNVMPPTPRKAPQAHHVIPADRRQTPANVQRRAAAHATLDAALDRTLTDPARGFGRLTLDLLLQDWTIQHAGAGFVPHEHRAA